MSILIAILVFGVLIFVHELGHFVAARAFGVKVNEFAVGMGPKLLSHKSQKSGTVYSLRALPIGGFNSIEGGDFYFNDRRMRHRSGKHLEVSLCTCHMCNIFRLAC